MIWKYLLSALLGYAAGGIMFSYHLPRMLKKVDVTHLGADGNPGAANAVKHAGIAVGMLCLLADVLKGWIPVQIGVSFLDAGSVWFAVVMLAPVLGHASAPFDKIPGGKAIAVSFGVLLGLCAQAHALWVLAGVYIFFSTIVIIRPNERRTVIAFGLLALWALRQWSRQKSGMMLGCMLMSLVVMWKNRNMPQETAGEAECAHEGA